MSGIAFSNIALVHDSNFGVTGTMNASVPLVPVLLYFNHNTMNTSENRYYKY